ncbi:hypothetical protein SPRG_19143 [Saprolegnia parasitica CBS 223.65]|uniref:Uncharacterized protein n=1 Tax=Saprolegnia parasitica (strain CBS 223.65) TaxID=695850 RepID=A0A067D6U0_SAPPC|nr:hypothetical protein SPRG_19143 [Saprolegnia parasitica CBS 223.65]KDO34416.1 hypothetical protein SPRG_19143 [Saprolegnia parasitica CBS 223.65]|eukprot:XP_012195327.1 hypothetical protein SPRG_19143 [Saprolegnia parasitica CBS 223.65]
MHRYARRKACRVRIVDRPELDGNVKASKLYDQRLMRCPYVRAIWRAFASMQDILQMQFPSAVAGFHYDAVAAPYLDHKSSIHALSPILRACVWYCVWLESKNRVFRATLTQLPAAALAVKTATITCPALGSTSI